MKGIMFEKMLSTMLRAGKALHEMLALIITALPVHNEPGSCASTSL